MAKFSVWNASWLSTACSKQCYKPKVSVSWQISWSPSSFFWQRSGHRGHIVWRKVPFLHVFVIDKKCFKTSGIDKKRQGEKIEQISYSLCLVNDPKTFVLNASEWKKLVSCLKCQKFINEIRSSETRKKMNLPTSYVCKDLIFDGMK